MRGVVGWGCGRFGSRRLEQKPLSQSGHTPTQPTSNKFKVRTNTCQVLSKFWRSFDAVGRPMFDTFVRIQVGLIKFGN